MSVGRIPCLTSHDYSCPYGSRRGEVTLCVCLLWWYTARGLSVRSGESGRSANRGYDRHLYRDYSCRSSGIDLRDGDLFEEKGSEGCSV
jgi:hypothetical protein